MKEEWMSREKKEACKNTQLNGINEKGEKLDNVGNGKKQKWFSENREMWCLKHWVRHQARNQETLGQSLSYP